jgi:transcription antitermination factor NusG
MWALAVTAPNVEHLVCKELRNRLRIPYHFFQQNKRIVRPGRVVDALVPAFPRYVLVPFEAAWDVARRIWRVIDLVHFGERVAPVSQVVVDHLIIRCQGDHILPAVAVPEPFKLGDCVHVGGYGPMAGHDAIYQYRLDGGKLCLLFDWMGRWVPIDIDQRDVSAARAAVSDGKARKRKKRRRPDRNQRVKHRPCDLLTVATA